MEKPSYPTLPILIIDDEEQTLISTRLRLRSAGIDNVICCEDPGKVMEILSTQQVGLILLDLVMPRFSGQQIQSFLVEKCPNIPVIIVTGTNDIETAVSCMKTGAIDYLVKPVEESRMIASIKRAIEMSELKLEYTKLKQHMLSGKLEHPLAFKRIVTDNPKMRAIFEYIETIAQTPNPVLVTGETGVGKELIVRAIHDVSKRKGSFVAVNVAGLDDNMFSDTLFGHIKGAFTDARNNRQGLIESAAEGTLFLDEIGDLGIASQVKLLRLLQEKEYLPLGADIPKRSDVRIIVATNQNLEELIQRGCFRIDLYYRLLIHRIHIPPLRERLDDLPILIERFMEAASESLNKNKPAPPPELFTILLDYSFPGNVRELESLIYEAVSKHKHGRLSMEVFKEAKRRASKQNESDEHKSEQLAQSLFSDTTPGRLPTLKQAESFLINEALKRTKGNQTNAADLLGITRQTVNRHLKRQDNTQVAEKAIL